MRNSRTTWTLLCSLAMSALGSSAPADALAVRAGKIVVGNGQVIDNGVLIVRDGKLAAVGRHSEVSVPPGCATLDATDCWVCPGIVEAHAHIAATGGLNDMVEPLNPELRISDSLDPDSPDLANARRGGVTTVNTIPGSGTNHAGYGVLYKTAGRNTADMVVRDVSVMKIAQAYNPERHLDLGHSRMGMNWLMDQWIAEVQGDQEGAAGRSANRMAAAALRGEIPVLVHTAGGRDLMRTVRMFHDRYHTRVIVSHAMFDGLWVAEEMAKREVHVNVGPTITDSWFTRDKRFWGAPAVFHEAGVKRLSLHTDANVLPIEDSRLVGTVSVRLGLDDETALRALTDEPAQAVMIGDRVGTLEVGKDADLIVSRGCPLDPAVAIELVLIEGRVVYERSRER